MSPGLGHMLTHTIGLSQSAVVSGGHRGELRLSPADVLVCGPAGGVARVRYTCASRGASGRRSFVPACEPDSSQQRSLMTLDAVPGGAAASLHSAHQRCIPGTPLCERAHICAFFSSVACTPDV
jgi:hypothetical protein